MKLAGGPRTRGVGEPNNSRYHPAYRVCDGGGRPAAGPCGPFRNEDPMRRICVPVMALIATMLSAAGAARAADDPKQWVVYEGGDGPGKGKRVVLIAGDEEYRSEEGLPQLGKILAKRHGFTCTVLFPVDDKGEINPKHTSNIPGLAALDSADLLVILTRFRNPPDEQMKHVDAYLKAGKPVIGLRTATHAFSGLQGEYAKYNYNYKGDDAAWAKGFGRLVLGETWVSHWGSHKNDSTHGVIAPGAAGDPILSGIKDREIWGASDVYEAHPPADAKVLLLGQISRRAAKATKEEIAKDKNYMLRPEDTKLEGKRNDPMMPVAWVKPYQLPGGKAGTAFTTTMGSSTDLENEALRRLIVNAAYQLVGMPVPAKADVAIVGAYNPTAYGFDGFTKGVKPADHAKME